jgi:hypothetical protein
MTTVAGNHLTGYNAGAYLLGGFLQRFMIGRGLIQKANIVSTAGHTFRWNGNLRYINYGIHYRSNMYPEQKPMTPLELLFGVICIIIITVFVASAIFEDPAPKNSTRLERHYQ